MRTTSPHEHSLGNSTSLSNRRAARIAPAVTLAVAALFLLPGPAAAYSDSLTTFSSGEAAASVTLTAGALDAAGPTLRIPSDAFIDSASLSLAGAPGNSTVATTHTTDTDFAGASSLSNVVLGGGTLSLAKAHGAIVLDEGNSFLASDFSGMHLDVARPALDGFAQGHFTTEVLTVPTAGWGALMADGELPANTTIEFEVLDPAYAVLVARANVTLGSALPLDPVAHPALRLRAHFNATGASALPTLHWAAIGQVAGDTPLAANRTLSDIRPGAGGLSIGGSSTAYARAGGNPVLTVQASSYRSVRVNTATFFQVNSTWHAFALVNSATGWAGTDIGHATSTDLTNWAWDAQPVLTNGTAGQWDDTAVSHPFVVENPAGSPRYFMYYSGWPNPTQFTTGLATSDDLYTWTKYPSNPVMVNAGGQWDSWNAAIRTVIYEGGQWKAWYAGTHITTGGGNSMGYATSANGISWTKYASNPVLAINTTAGSIERDDLQLATVRKAAGTYYAVFGCIPTGGAYAACLATSPNGISWTLHPSYIMTRAGTGWEGAHAPASDIMVEDGRFTLWYAGCSAGCATEQVGRAYGHFINGTVSNIIDFGTQRPTSLDDIALNGTFPAGSQATLAVRSSSNGLAWSSFEAVPSNGTITSTQPNRFFEWRVSLNATAGSAPPVYRSVRLNYSAYAAQGRYESADIALPDPAGDAAVQVLATLPGPSSVSAEVSADGGSSWLAAAGGAPVALGAPSTSVRYALTLRGGTYQAPAVDAVTLAANTSGLPADVTLRLGAAGSPFFSSTGPLAPSPTAVPLPVSQLNFILDSARAANPNATYVDIALHLSASHFGVVLVSGLTLAMTRPNPIDATFAPVGALSVAENQTAQFTADAVSPYAPLFITWLVDGSEMAGARNQPAFNFTPSFDMAGPHTVVCVLENGDTTVTNQWAVTVTDVNRPPTVFSVSPASPASFSHASSVVLSVNATDLDGQLVSYAWQLDGVALPAATFELIASGLALGAHTATVTVGDGVDSATASWNFEVTDAAPTATGSPAGDQAVSHTGSLALTVSAADADGDTIAYAWRVDGVAVTATGATYTLTRPATGVHTVDVRVTGGSRSVTLLWNITATNAAPQVESRDPTAPSTVAFGATMALNISVSDADGDPITAVWTIDGHVVQGTASQLMLPTDLAPGPHEVKYTGTDPDGAKVEAMWGVTVNAPPPSTPAPGAWLAVAALAAAAVAGLGRRRGGPRGPAP